MDYGKRQTIVETLRKVSREEFDIEGNPYEPNPPQLRHMEMMEFAGIILPLAVTRRLSWRLSDAERSFLAKCSRALVATSNYYRETMAEVDSYQAQFHKTYNERVANLQRRAVSR